MVRYAHIGTGNFNEKTRIYTDYSLLTADARITNEVRRVFNFIENPYRPVSFDYLLVSPQNSRRLHEMIDREIANAQNGQPSGITLKLNNPVDKGLVDRLYAASSSGACRLIADPRHVLADPGSGRYQRNIRVISMWTVSSSTTGSLF